MATFAGGDGAAPVLAEWDLRHGNANTNSVDAGRGDDPDTEADDVDDFEALRVAALEKLPLERRSRIAILPKVRPEATPAPAYTLFYKPRCMSHCRDPAAGWRRHAGGREYPFCQNWQCLAMSASKSDVFCNAHASARTSQAGGAKVADDVELADVRNLTAAQRRVLVDRSLGTRDQVSAQHCVGTLRGRHGVA